MVVIFTAGENISMKSMPYRCVLPLMTNRALYLSMEPSALSLTLYIHLLLIAFFPGGRSTSVQVLFACKAYNLDSIALTQSGSSDA